MGMGEQVMKQHRGELYQHQALQDRSGIFEDRHQAGILLAQLLEHLELPKPLIMAIPAGGVPVAIAMAKMTGWPLDLAVTSKITLPWNPEAGYGAVAFDDGVLLNEKLLPQLGLSEEEIMLGIEQTRKKIARRNHKLRGDRPLPEVKGRTLVLVDDGLASGLTMRAAANALRKAGGTSFLVATPTAHIDAVNALRARDISVCCANLRHSYPFAVASAYRHWRDISEEEVLTLLQQFRTG